MATYTTEIASDTLTSDNPIHQRLLKAYLLAEDYATGDLLELGCGEGRGIEVLKPHVGTYTAIDKIGEILEDLQIKHPDVHFIQSMIPPLSDIESNRFDSVVSFQVIEHIDDDRGFLEEIYRVLKPGGHAVITTPNKPMSLSRNPWHVREYTTEELKTLCEQIFDEVSTWGIEGNDKVMDYYEANKASVKAITKYDVLNLQYRLPRWVLRIPYDILNRLNRNNLQKGNDGLVNTISHEDYLLTREPGDHLDHFFILRKKD